MKKGGSLYAIDPRSGTVDTISDSLWAADGLWIDQSEGFLYVGQLFEGTVVVYDINTYPPIQRETLRGINGGSPGSLSYHGFIDDFTVTYDGYTIVACNWIDNTIVTFPSSSTTSSDKGVHNVVTHGVTRPTSARFGYDVKANGAFPATSLFVTEGRATDYIIKSKEDRLLRIDFDDESTEK